MKAFALIAAIVLCVLAQHCWGQKNTNEADAIAFLKRFNDTHAKYRYNASKAGYEYGADINPTTEKASIDASLALAEFASQSKEEAETFDTTNMSADVKRQFFFLTLGDSPKDPKKLQEKLSTIASMESTYSKGQVCNKTRCYSLNPDLYSIIGKSRNYDELTFAWRGWRDSVGRNVKRDYIKYVELSNLGAKDNGYADEGAYWRVQYELPDKQFYAELEKLWTQMKPFYEQLHAYVRGKLRQKYGSDKISEDGPIPAHLLGNMWAQSWENLYDLLVPYPNQPIVDVTQEMIRQNFTVLKMFELSEEFFLSIGMKRLPEIFWKNSIIEKRKNVAMTCHASAWDLYLNYDVR